MSKEISENIKNHEFANSPAKFDPTVDKVVDYVENYVLEIINDFEKNIALALSLEAPKTDEITQVEPIKEKLSEELSFLNEFSLDGIFLQGEPVILPNEEIYVSFEEAFLSYLLMDETAFVAEYEELLKLARVESEPNFLNVSFEELFNIPVSEGSEQSSTMTQYGLETGVFSQAQVISYDFFSTFNLNKNFGTVLSIGVDLALTQSVVDTLESPPQPVISTMFGNPSSPDVDVTPSFTLSRDSEVLLNTYNNIILEGNVFNDFGASFGPETGPNQATNIYFGPHRPGDSEDRSIPGVVILTTPEGNTLTYYTASVYGHNIGDFVFNFNNSVLTPPEPYTTDMSGDRIYTYEFVYSMRDNRGSTSVGDFRVLIVDDHPVATDQAAASAILEANIPVDGSNQVLSGNFDRITGSLIVPSVLANISPPDGILSDNRFGADGGTVTNVTLVGMTNTSVTGVTTLNHIIAPGEGFSGSDVGDTAIKVTDSRGNTLIVDILNGNYVYTLNNSLINTVPDSPATEIFNYVFTDAEGQTANANFTVTLNDDAPVAVMVSNSISEADIKTVGSNGSVINDTISGFLVPSVTSILTSRYGADEAATGGGVTNVSLDGVTGATAVTAIVSFANISLTDITNSNGGFTISNLGHASIIVTDSLGNTLQVDRITSKYVYTLNQAFHNDVPDQSASVSYTYELTDKDGSIATNHIVFTVDDDGPHAYNNTNSVDETALFVNSPTAETATGNILTDSTNDIFGADGGSISLVNGAIPVSGIITVATTYGSIDVYTDNTHMGFVAGDYVYTLDSAKTTPVSDALLSVVDTISYQLTDGDGSTSSATLKVTVDLNQAPTAVNDTRSTNENTAFSVAAAGVLSNDTDPDSGDTKTVISIDTTGTVGLVTFNANGSYSYDPNGQFEYLDTGENATDSFDYTMRDAEGLTSTATVTVTITGVNDAPIAVNDSNSVDDNTTITLASTAVGKSTNLLFNDSDPDTSDTLLITEINGKSINDGDSINLSHGTLVIHTDGSYSYTPDNVPSTKSEVFSYTVSDGTATDTANVTITINDVAPPVIFDLNHDGKINLISPESSHINLSMLGADSYERIGWVAPEDGILMYDINGNGKLTNLNQISFTSYTPGAKTDLEGLVSFDTNHDGKLDTGDTDYSKFGVWQDKNSNAIVDAGEYLSLAQRNISALSLTSDHHQETVANNTILGSTTFETTDGKSHLAADVNLRIISAEVIQAGNQIDFSTLPEISAPPLQAAHYSNTSVVAGDNSITSVEVVTPVAIEVNHVTQHLEQQVQPPAAG